MESWRRTGYVPDSDGEDGDWDTPHASPRASLDLVPAKGTNLVTTPTLIDEEPQSTTQKLDAVLKSGLKIVRQIRDASLSAPPVGEGSRDASPLSSPLSSLGSSPTFEPLEIDDSLLQHDLTLDERPVFQSQAFDIYEVPSISSRRFRTRRPEQLNPYTVEDARYRNSMISRGIKPVRNRQEIHPEELHNSTEVSQGLESFSSSQVRENTSFQIPPGSPLAVSLDTEERYDANKLGQVNSERGDDLDGDLPELSQIFNGSPKYERRSQGLHVRPSKDPQVQRHIQESVALEPLVGISNTELPRSSQNALRIPPSPPKSTASSQDGNLTKEGRSSSARFDYTPIALPTPLFSSEISRRKRGATTIIVSDSSESDGSDIVNNYSEEDDSQERQTLARRIKGVLPGSFATLDRKRQARSLQQKQSAHSPSKLINERGIARLAPSWVRKLPSPKQTHLDRLEDLADTESDDTQDQEDQIQNSRDRSTVLGDFDLPVAEAVEDSVVDFMMPSSRLGRKFPNHSRKTQRRLKDHFMSYATSLPSGPEKQIRTQSQPRNGRRASQRKKIRWKSGEDDLSLFDAPGLREYERNAQPQYLRLAARQAKNVLPKRSGKRSTKFFQLATKGDTIDVHNSLMETHQQQGKKPVQRSFHTVPHAIREAPDTFHERRTVQNETSTNSIPKSKPDIDKLKTASSELLKRLADRTEHSKSNSSMHASSYLLKSEEQKQGLRNSLSALFSYHNRSGRGRFWSLASKSRPAQLQTEKPVVHAVALQLQQKIPRRVRKTLASTLLSFDAPNASDQQLDANPAHKDQTLGSQQSRPKQSQRKRKPVENTTVLENERPVLHADPTKVMFEAQGATMSYDSEAGYDQGSIKNISMATKAMKALNLYEPHEILTKDGVVRSGTLFETVAVSKQGDRYKDTWRPREPSSIFLPDIDRFELHGEFDAQIERCLAQCYTSILMSVDSGLSSDHSTSNAIRCMRSIVHYVNTSLSFPPSESCHVSCVASLQTLKKPRSNFLASSVRFLNTALLQFEKADAITLEPMLRRLSILNWLVVYAFQVVTVSNFERCESISDHNVVADAQATLQRFVSYTLGLALQSRSLLAQKYDSEPDQDQKKDTNVVHGDSLVLTLHLSKLLSRDESYEQAFAIVKGHLKCQNDPGHIRDLCEALNVLAFVVRGTRIDLRGTSVHDELTGSASVSHQGWNLLIPLLNRHFSEIGKLSRTNPLRQFFADIVCFLHHLCIHWNWKPTASILTTLLKAYSGNNMVPFGPLPSVYDIFYNPASVTQSPENLEGDYDMFIDMVRVAVNHQSSGVHSPLAHNAPRSAQKLRGLVFSLIPNNAEFFDALQDLPAQSFLGLKNRFALYLALYRSAPASCGPRIEQMERQIDLVLSHFVVSKLAFKIWEVVAVHETERASFDYSTLREIGIWSHRIILQLLERHKVGQDDAWTLLQDFLSTMEACLNTSVSELHARLLIEPTIGTLEKLLKSESNISRPVLTAIQRVLIAYVEKTRSTQNVDTLTTMIEPILKCTVQNIIRRPEHVVDATLIEVMAVGWFKVAHSLVHSSHRRWDNYLQSSSALSLDFFAGSDSAEMRQHRGMVSCFQQLFLSEVIKVTKGDIFLDYRVKIIVHWVSSLLSPLIEMGFTNRLTTQILRYGSDSLQLRRLADKFRKRSAEPDLTNQEVADARVNILRHIIRAIFALQHQPEAEYIVGGLDLSDMRLIIDNMVVTMKQVWQDQRQDPIAQNEYTGLVKALLHEMEIHPLASFKVDPFFTSVDSQFPTEREPFAKLFRIRPGELAGSLQKSAIVTFRYHCFTALDRGQSDKFVDEISKAFVCVSEHGVLWDDEKEEVTYSVDLAKMDRFIQDVFPAYIMQAKSTRGSQIAVPIIQALTLITAKVIFRPNGLKHATMRLFISATCANLLAVRSALRAQMVKTSLSTKVLLDYAIVAIDMVWNLMSVEEVEVTEDVHCVFCACTLSLAALAAECAEIEPAHRLQLQLDEPEILCEEDQELQDYTRSDLEGELPKWAKLDIAKAAEVNKSVVSTAAGRLYEFIKKLPLLPAHENMD